jgi:predicted nuclease of restriction endonuclease-like RecB superfamily
MMLPLDGISYKLADGRIFPRWLDPDDVLHVDAVLEAVSAFDGLTVEEIAVVAEHGLPTVGRSSRIAQAIWSLERKRWVAEIDAPAPPETIRAVVFDCAATMPREEALAHAAAALGLEPAIVAASLFADRTSRRRLRAPATHSAALDMIARYNLAVVQTLLARAMEIEAATAADVRPIALAAKRDGLLVRLLPEGRLVLTGPLALFHETVKYGRSIARFVPSLVATEPWSLAAKLSIFDRQIELRLDEGMGIALPAILPAPGASALARKAVRALERAGVIVDQQPPILRTGDTVIVPDFSLELADGRTVYVDVLPFATEEHLAAKLAAVAALGVPMLVCVDERYLGATRSANVVPYRRTVEAWALLGAVTRSAA